MALFDIQRFTVEDEGEKEEKSAADILADIHRQAEIRRKQNKTESKKRKLSTSKDNDVDIKKTKISKKEISSDAVESKKRKLSTSKENDVDIKKPQISKKEISSDAVGKKEKSALKRKKKVKQDSEDEAEEDKTKSKETPEVEVASEVEDTSEVEESEVTAINEEDVKADEHESSGFTVIGAVRKGIAKEVHRVLPEWLAKPSVIQADIHANKRPVEETTALDQFMQDKLKAEGITHLFPVQTQVIPALLEGCDSGFCCGRAGYRSSDICCSAPTGSGKTLAFALPIIQALRKRQVPQIRALVVLPVGDLASQVYRVFHTYCSGTPLTVGRLFGHKTFAVEQAAIVKKGLRGYQSLVDIVVATPGRLVDHITKTAGFSLRHLRFLVMDEADRTMEEIKQEWLSYVETAVYSPESRPTPAPVTADSAARMELPLQKLLFSATLSQNPEKLQQLKLFQPKLFTSVVKPNKKPDANTEEDDYAMDISRGDFIGKYTTPSGLTEYYIEADVSYKPLMIMYFLQHLKFRHILCFTNSVESTHRLYCLVKLAGVCNVQEFSSSLSTQKRQRMLKQFSASKIDMLICSDAMARGMDVEGVRYVVSYEVPPYLKTYIHRVGRTARAGSAGVALTLLERREIVKFKRMCKEAGKIGIKEMSIKKTDLKPFMDVYQQALHHLPEMLKRTKRKT